MQSPLAAHLVKRYVVCSYVDKLSERRTSRAVYNLVHETNIYIFNQLFQLSRLYFFNTRQWWKWTDFLSRILSVRLYKDCNDFREVVLACDQVVKQYVIWEMMIECMCICWHVISNESEIWKIEFDPVTNLFHLSLERKFGINQKSEVLAFRYNLWPLPWYTRTACRYVHNLVNRHLWGEKSVQWFYLYQGMFVHQWLQSVQYTSSLDISIVSVSVSGAVQSAVCHCNHRSVLGPWLCFCLSDSMLFVLLRLPQTHHCATEIHESLSVTFEWQLEKVINVLTQWWSRFQLSNAIRRKNDAFVVRKRLNRVTQFVSLMKRQRSTFIFGSSRQEGKNKEHVRLRWTQVICGPHFLHVSEMNHFTLKRQNQINISVIKVQLQYAGYGSFFSVYCVIFQQRRDLKHQITGTFTESLGTSDLAVFLLTELQVSAEQPLMASKWKGKRLREGG